MSHTLKSTPNAPRVLWKSVRQWISEKAEGRVGQCLLYLLVDQPTDRERIKQALCSSAPGEYRIREFSDPTSMLEALEDQVPDALVLSLALSNGGGLAVLRQLAHLGGRPPCPVVALSEVGDDRLVAAALRAGAHDVVARDRMCGPTIGRAIGFACDSFRVQMELEERRRELEAMNRELREKRVLLQSTLGSVTIETRRPRGANNLSTLAARVARASLLS